MAGPSISARTSRCRGPHLGFPRGPEDLLIDEDGRPNRIDKAFSWDAPLVDPRADAHGDRQCACRRSVPGRRAVPLHGQHGLELVDEHGRRHQDAGGQGSGDRRIPHPQDHLFRRLCLGDGRLCRPRAARHHLSRAARLHLAARPADLGAGCRAGRDPLAGRRARPRRARLPVGADRPRRTAAG